MERRRAWPFWTAGLVIGVAIVTLVWTQLAVLEAGAEVITPDPTPQPAPSDASAPAPSPTPSPWPSPSPSPGPTPTPTPTPTPSSSPIPNGKYVVAPGSNHLGTGGRLLRYAVEVEDGLEMDVARFARAVDRILGNARSWTGTGSLRLERVDSGSVHFRVTLASPATVDKACLPLDTDSWLSCWNGSRVMLNVDRWTDGAETYGDDIPAYRRYLVNHEVGHALGHNHVGCPGKGERAPVMLQQTKSLSGCVANPWPYPDNQPAAPDPSPSAVPTGTEPAVVPNPVASSGRTSSRTTEAA